jgi:tetratricopeptide (TPR) repeat protein
MTKPLLITTLLLGLVLPAQAEFTPNISWTYKATDTLYNVSISKNGERIAAGSRDGSIYLLDGKGNLLNKYRIGQDITAISLSGNGLYLVAKSRDLLYLFGEDLKFLWKYKMKDWIEGIHLSRDGRFIACASRDNYVYLLNNMGELLWKYRVLNQPKAVAIDAFGQFVAVGSKGYISFLDGRGRLMSKYETDEEIKSITVSDSGENIIGASQNWLYFLSKDGKLLWKKMIDDEIKAVSLSGDGKYISLGSAIGNIYLLNQHGKFLWKHGFGNCIWGVALTGDGEYLAVTPWDSYIYFLETKGRKEFFPLLEAHLSRGYDYLDKGQSEDAIIEFLQVLSIDPENPKAIEGIEKARSLRKKPAIEPRVIEPTLPPEKVGEKIEVAEKVEIPKREEARLRYPNVLTLLILLILILSGFTLALIYQKRENRIRKRYDELLTYQRTSGYLPENKDLVKMLANLYKEEGIFDSTSALAYDKAEMFGEAALSYQNAKDLTKAAEMYEKKSSSEGDDYDILQRLAQIYHHLGQEDRIVNIFRRMVAVREEPYDLSVLGELCEKLKDTEGAISAYEKLSQLDRESPEYQDKLLKLYFDNGHKEKFFTLAKEVRMRRELTLDNLSKLARTYVENSIFDKASEIYRRLTEEKPEHRYELIETLLIQSRIDEALEECQRLPLTNSQEANNLLSLYGKINEKNPENSQIQNLIEETYRKAEEKGLEVNLPTKNNEREQIFRPPLIEAQEPYTILTENPSQNPHSNQ